MTKHCVTCKKQSTFGIPGSKKASHCAKHKLPQMVNVLNKTCLQCNKQPNFGIPGSKKASHCATHKLSEMVNVNSKTCLECDKQPKFGIPGSKKASHCATHKLPEMVNVKDKTCLECNKQPNFGIPGSKKASYCATHKLSEMVNVKDKTCLECDKIPKFGIPGSKKASHCLTHKLPEMINVKDKTCLQCDKIPNFGIPGSKKASHCATHKLPEMINVLHKTCVSEWCSIQVKNKHYKGYCLRCFVHLFPNNQIVRNYKTKERTVVDFIMRSFPAISWTWDRRVVDGCSGAKPDLICDLGDQIVIIEIDENQHGSYDCTCENKRIMKLSLDVGHRALVLIRFNPDTYRTRDGVRHKSCFGVNDRGLLVVTEHADWDRRLLCLKDQVEYWVTARTSKMVEVVPLFFTETS